VLPGCWPSRPSPPHLLNQIVVPGELLRVRVRQLPAQPPLSILESILEHYARTIRTDADLDDEPNVSMRRDGADRAAGGPRAACSPRRWWRAWPTPARTGRRG
jgi:hypothetical protein